MSEISFDIDNVCRLCLHLDDGRDNMILIYGRPDIVNMIQRCVQIEVKLDSHQPTKICKSCVSYLDSWNRYKIMCNNNETLIQDYIQINESYLKLNSENINLPVQDISLTEISPLDLEYFESESALSNVLQQIDEVIVMDTSTVVMDASCARKVQPPEVVHIQTESGEEHIDRAGKSMNTEVENTLPHEQNCGPTSITGLSKRKKKYKRKNYNCNICSLLFPKFNDLIAHDLEIHEPISKQIICKNCGKCFLTNERLKIHMRFHRTKIFDCDICLKKYTSLKTLKTHMNIHEGIYHCPMCDFNGSSPSALKVHQNTHSLVKKHLCQVCLENYATPSSLRRHRLIHENIDFYQCDQCNYSTDNSTNLKFHKFIHNPESLVCHHCGRIFANQNLLRSHSKTHTQREFKCNNCHKIFKTKLGLKNHLSKFHE